jgi:hypothetical protein
MLRFTPWLTGLGDGQFPLNSPKDWCNGCAHPIATQGKFSPLLNACSVRWCTKSALWESDEPVHIKLKDREEMRLAVKFTAIFILLQRQ